MEDKIFGAPDQEQFEDPPVEGDEEVKTCLAEGSEGVPALGKVYTFGSDKFGVLGNGNVSGGCEPTPYHVKQVGSKVKQVQAGGSYTCAVTGSGKLYIWGCKGDTPKPVHVPLP